VQPLLEPVELGSLRLRNRIIMAPMTRNRALPDDVPGLLAVDYYGARAGAGLIVTEGTQPSVHGKGYCRTPGAHSEAQVQGWQAVTRAVHARGGCIVLQLMHCGRIGSHLNKAPGARTLAPSAVRAAGRIFTEAAGLVDFDTPEALTLAEVQAVLDEYAHAARARPCAPASMAWNCTPPPATCRCSS
jgi:2,4-dienoyl-CoA reductase-like NADH-dependent reductase (Old Yellow Enzyme family)